MYICSKCKLGVIIMEGKTIKACKCDTPIIAEMTTKLKGLAKLK
jgi:hypothetical protein